MDNSKQEYDPVTKRIAKILLNQVVNKKNGCTITYGEVSSKMNNAVYPVELRSYLAEISNACKLIGLPYLSVIVCNSETGVPGNGFFDEFFPEADELKRMKFLSECLSDVISCTNWHLLEEYMGL